MPSDSDIYRTALYGCEDPSSIPSESWINSVSLWPTINLIDINNYLVNGTSLYTGAQMKNYKSQCDGFKLFEDSHVQKVVYCRTDTMKAKGLHCLRAQVLPSQRQNKESHYDTWTLIQDNGEIKSAHCSCMAG